MTLTQNYTLIDLRVASVEDQLGRMFGKGENYFSVGHSSKYGEDLSESQSSKPVLWYWDGELHTENVDVNKGVTSHIAVWGDAYAKHFFGRYEPWSGNLTVVKPARFRMRGIPEFLLQELHSKFPNINEVREF